MHSGFVSAGGQRLEYVLYPGHQIDRPTLVFLHEGLGSISLWRDFPARVALATGCRTLVYSRHGHGHSDGASIALIHGGDGRWPCDGIVVLAPHVFVEEMSLRGIEATVAVFETAGLPQRLARHHQDAYRTFYGWADIWRHPDFRNWNIEEYLAGLRCPILAIQGVDDEYASMAHLERIAASSVNTPAVNLLKLADCRHSPQRDQADAVMAAVLSFVSRVG